LFNAQRRADRFDAELESHLEMHIEENVRRGMTPEEAGHQALVALGGPQAIRDTYRDRGSVPFLESLAHDFRFAIRMLRKSPGFTVVAVIVLAVGIGAPATVFSLVNALLLRPLNRGDDVKLVSLYIGTRTKANGFRPFRYDEYEEIRDRSDAFGDVIAERRARTGLTENGLTRRVSLTLASANYFSAFGVPMAAGRSFTREEEQPDSNAAVAVVAYRYWRARGLRPLIGERLTLNNRMFEIVGVAGEGFNGTVPLIVSDVWLPLGASGLIGRDPRDPRASVVSDRAQTRSLREGGAGAAGADRGWPGRRAPGGEPRPRAGGDAPVENGPRPQSQQRYRGAAGGVGFGALLRARAGGRMPQPREHHAGPRQPPSA
jgi:hypothetical protein